MVRSSPRVAKTIAGLSFAALRSVKGNLTRTTSPGWMLVGIEIRFVQPFAEPRLAQSHPLSDLNPFRDLAEDHFELLGRKLTEQFRKLFGCNLNRHSGDRGSLQWQQCISGGKGRQLTAAISELRLQR